MKSKRPTKNTTPLSKPLQSEEHPSRTIFEVEVLNGLKTACKSELLELLDKQIEILPSDDPDRIAFYTSAPLRQLMALRTAVAVFKVLYFKVPHPGSIISGEEGARLFAEINGVTTKKSFRSFRIGAAGSDSAVFQRARRLIERHCNLTSDDDNGDMSIRFRRSRLHRFGWDVLVRLSPRPLSTRSWRVENMPGALNATIAAAIIYALEPSSKDRFLNLMCGSGTFLAERALISPAQQLIGIDLSEQALAKASRNLRGFPQITLLRQDATKSTLASDSVNVICADLPWGRLVGERATLAESYSGTLREMARVCAPDGKAALLTQESEILENALTTVKNYWSVLRTFRVKQSDYKPKVYLLQRTHLAC